MLGFSKTVGYAVQALSCLDEHEPHLNKDLGAALTIPKAYLCKVINRLAHEGLVETKRGRKGGIVLSRAPEKITLLQVVKAVEGSDWMDPCMLGMDTCVALRFCPFSTFWEDLRNRVETALRTTTLADIIAQKNRTATRSASSQPSQACATPFAPEAAEQDAMRP